MDNTTHFTTNLTHNSQASTPNLSPEDNEALGYFKEDLLKSIEEGVAAYKYLMDKILEFKQPFKESELQNYHDSTVKRIRTSFESSYCEINSKNFASATSQKFQQHLFLAQMRLDTLMNAQYNEIYLRKHEIDIDNIVTKLKRITDEVTMFYDSQADQMQLEKKSRIEIKNGHNKLVQSAQEMFERLLEKHQFTKEDFLMHELKQILRERLEDVVGDDFDVDGDSPQSQTKCEITDLPKKEEGSGISVKKDLEIPAPQEPKPQYTQSTIRRSAKAHSENDQELWSNLIQLEKNRRHGFYSAPNWDMKEVVKTVFAQYQKNSSLISTLQPGNRAANFPILQPGKPVPGSLGDPETLTVFPSRIKQEQTLGEQIHRRTIDVGIYFDQKSFRVMTIRPSDKHALKFEEIGCASPDIFFSDNGILWGEEATRYRSRKYKGCYKSFNIFQLATSFEPPLPGHISIVDKTFTLCTHQIIAAFFLNVFGNVEANNEAKIGNIVITVPFHPFTAVKERIQKAGKIAGFPQIQMQSSLLTTAISTLDPTKSTNPDCYSENSQKTTKFVFIHDLQKLFFSMGIIEISPNCISLVSKCGSDNLKQCKGESFLREHKNLLQDKMENNRNSASKPIIDAYSKAVEHVTKELRTCERRIVVNDTNPESVTGILHKQIGSMVKTTNIFNGPLKGASMLASKACVEIKAIHPLNTKVVESCECDLQLSMLPLGDEVGISKTSKCTIGENIRFKISVAYGTPYKVRFLLEENYGDDEEKFQVALYELSVIMDSSHPDKKRQNVNVDIKCLKGEDGELKLEVEELEEDYITTVGMLRVDNATCISACAKLDSTGFKRFIEYLYSDSK